MAAVTVHGDYGVQENKTCHCLYVFPFYLPWSDGTRDQIANICWIANKAREFQKNIYFCFIKYAKAFDCVDHKKLENS